MGILNLRSRDLERIASTVDLASQFARRIGKTEPFTFTYHAVTIDCVWFQHEDHFQDGGYRVANIYLTNAQED